MSSTYQEVFSKIKTLSLDEQYQLLQQLREILNQHLNTDKERSILEMEGLGKEIWTGIDVKKYLDKERESWNG